MRKLHVERIRALACFGIGYHCIIGETSEAHLKWASEQDRAGLMQQIDDRTLLNGGKICVEIPEEETTLFVVAYREKSELTTETAVIPAGDEDVYYEVETAYDGNRRLALKLNERHM